ncbi:hypothetical protein MBLNU230_g7071t1 [Neophaeotheca triangularis]
MELYLVVLVILLALNAILAYRKHQKTVKTSQTNIERVVETLKQDVEEKEYESDDSGPSTASVDGWAPISRQYLIVYALAVAADWLQGSFIYPLYKHEYALPESTVAALFATGFASGAISATGIGYLADRFGRKKACLGYCFLYALSCALTMVNSQTTLFAGRVLGGVSTTLLYSAFEAWMVAEASSRENSHEMIQDTLASAATINAVVAIVSGFASEASATLFSSKRAPFAGSIACLMVAGFIIAARWVGVFVTIFWRDSADKTARVKTTEDLEAFHMDCHRIALDFRTVILTAVTCAMEGSMYAMVVFWVPSLERVRPTLSGEAPYGIIFANFMSAMMLGSHLFWSLTKSSNSVTWVAMLIQLCLPISALCLLTTVLNSHEYIRFLAFCIFEASVGLYFPCIGLLKSKVVADANRSWTYGLMRVPLNAFVVGILSSTGEGDVYRQHRFIACSGLLLCSTVLMRWLHELPKRYSGLLKDPDRGLDLLLKEFMKQNMGYVIMDAEGANTENVETASDSIMTIMDGDILGAIMAGNLPEFLRRQGQSGKKLRTALAVHKARAEEENARQPVIYANSWSMRIPAWLQHGTT